MTYEELIAKCKEGDPLILEGGLYDVTPQGLYIHGNNGPVEFASDLLIKIEEGGFWCYMRDPPGTTEEDRFHGPEWAEESWFREYDDLVSWAYSW